MKLEIRCAPAGVGAGANLGMNTVDLAIWAIVREVGGGENVKLVRPWPAYSRNHPNYLPKSEEFDRWPMRFDYPEPLGDHLGESSNVLFWGDFQHGWDYQRQSARRLQEVISYQGGAPSLDRCLEWCYSYFLLEDGIDQDRIDGVGMYGGTLFQNRLVDYTDAKYRNALFALYRKAAFVRVRDPYSAWKISSILENWKESFLGMDGAFLNDENSFSHLELSNSPELKMFQGGVGVFFGRSMPGFPWWGASRLLRELQRRLRAPLVWLPWGRYAGGLFGSRKKVIDALLPRMLHLTNSVGITPGDILNSIRSLKLVVTDTYHLAINCFVLGVPVVCIYEPSPRSFRNANMGFREAWRDKRVLLYLNYDLAEYLVASTDLNVRKHRRQKAATIVDLVEKRTLWENAQSELRKNSLANRKMIVQYLRNVLKT